MGINPDNAEYYNQLAELSQGDRIYADQITQYLEAAPYLDVDGNGSPEISTDGKIVLKYLFAPELGINPDNAEYYNQLAASIGPGATRTTGQELKEFLDIFYTNQTGLISTGI